MLCGARGNLNYWSSSGLPDLAAEGRIKLPLVFHLSSPLFADTKYDYNLLTIWALLF